MSREKLYPWIPIVGIPLTLKSSGEETGLNNGLVWFGSVLLQGSSIAAFTIYLIVWIFR